MRWLGCQDDPTAYFVPMSPRRIDRCRHAVGIVVSRANGSRSLTPPALLLAYVLGPGCLP